MSGNTIRIEGRDVTVATVDGSQDVFSVERFTLTKPRWVGDNEVTVCMLCTQKFNQLRRKHHCRQCGQVLCSKCCQDKMCLPHLGQLSPDRVCSHCRPMAELITKALSTQTVHQVAAADGLLEHIKDPKSICQVLEQGGVQCLVFLAKTKHDTIRLSVVSGLQQMAMYTVLHPSLAQSGAILAFCRILCETQENQTQLITESLSTLVIFSKTEQLRKEVLVSGGLQGILPLCSCSNEMLSLLALSLLGHVTESQDTHDMLVDSERNPVSKILSFLNSHDEQVHEISLKILAHLSMGSDKNRQKIIQEDMYSGNSLAKVLNKRPKNIQVLCNAACLVGNLAICQQMQGPLQEHVWPLCQLVEEFRGHTDLMYHVARTLANLAATDKHSQKLVQHIPSFISTFLKSDKSTTRIQGLRIILSLMSHSPQPTVDVLLNDGAKECLMVLAERDGMLPAVLEAAQKLGPSVVKPM